MFKVGDKVSILPGNAWEDYRDGDVVEVWDSWVGGGGIPYLRTREGGPARRQERFVLVEAAAAQAIPDPTQPYPNPEREAAEQQLRELVEYKRKMRDFLYGTSSTDN